jgi:hypothetical protein
MHSIQVLASGYTYYVLNPLESIQYDLQLASVPVNANATVEFYAALPSPIITNPQNAVYNESMVPLQFTLGSSASWIGYSLDGKANVTITGNTTLTGLTMGEHYLTVYTNDTLGTSYVSQTIDFSIALKDHYVTIAVIAVPVAIVFLITGLLLYRRHRRTAS